jgi:hypothetical protein
MAEDDLDRVVEGEGWTIREIVHHMVDTDVRQTTHTKIALANSGSTMEFGWHPGNRIMSEKLGYAGRSIQPALTLFRANREHFVQMLDSISPAWDRYLLVKANHEAAAEKVTVAEWVEGMARHVQEHIREIEAISQRVETTVMMALAETGFAEWHEKGEDIYGNEQ